MTFVTSRQVRELRDRVPGTVLLDVRIPEDFAAAHLATAVNACVFQVSFLDDVRRLVPDPTTPLVVYGTNSSSLESTEATQRLAQAGYTQVHNFPGGLEEWRRDGLPTLGDGPRPEPPPLDGLIPVDLAESRVEWTGRNLLNKHWGTVALSKGALLFRQGWLTGGELVVDMTSIACTDLADAALNRILIEHLKSPDFLDVARHPEARLSIRDVAPVPGGHPGAPNLQLACDFTLRGITRRLTVIAVAGRTPEGRVAAQAVFSFDRTEWGSAYGSGRFFRSLGRHLVNDLVELQVRLLA